jgi:hypothetical protein
MDTADAKSTIVDVPVDDGSIGRALDALEAKITSWTSAMAAAQRALAQAQTAPPPEPVARAAAPEVAEAVPPAEPGPETSAPQPSQAGEAPAKRKGKGKGKKTGLRLGHLAGKQERPVAPKKGIRVYEEEPAGPDPKIEDTNAEDEALLATLDPKIARQIRIRRRLSNGKKSVRDLLREI